VTLAEEQRLVRENLLATMRGFAQVREGAFVAEEAGLCCVYSGMAAGIFNAVLLREPVRDAEELRLKLRVADSIYRKQRARWTLWVEMELVGREVAAKLNGLVEEFGLRRVIRTEAMIAEKLERGVRELPKLEVLPVYAPATRYDFCHVMSVAFRTSLSMFLDVYHTPQYWDGGMRGYVGYWNGRAVGTTCVMASAGSLGLYGVATLPDMQRKGVGEAMVRHALREAERETGLQASVLQSSEEARALYRKLGYRKVGTVMVYNEG
jgi:ribosomal protein S18 acetylase RimI-like enzyme